MSWKDVAANIFKVLILKAIFYGDPVSDNSTVTIGEVEDPDTNEHV